MERLGFTSPAISPECCTALVAAGQRHLKEGIRLELFERKFKTTVESKDPVVSEDRISFIYGLESKGEENMAKVVRKMVICWNEKAVHGNFISKVEWMTNCSNEMDVKFPLQVVAKDANACEALVTTAQKYLSVSEGIQWKRFSEREIPNIQNVEEHFVDALQYEYELENDSQNNSTDERERGE